MKKAFFVFAGALVVIGGLFFIFHISQNSSRVPSETASSQQVNTASRQGSAEPSSASQSSTTTSLPANSSDSTANGSSVSTGSDQQSSSSSLSTGSTSANISSSPTQAVNRPQGAWVKSFEKILYKNYHVTPSRYVYIGKGYWEVWVKETDTGQYPYVTVNQYTGNFHG